MTRQEMIEHLGWHHQTMTEDQQDTLSRVERIVEVAVLRERWAEREVCAKICEAKSEHWWARWKHQADLRDMGMADGADECAQAIRWRT